MACDVCVQMTDTELMMSLDGIELNRTVQRKRFVLLAKCETSAMIHGI